MGCRKAHAPIDSVRPSLGEVVDTPQPTCSDLLILALSGEQDAVTLGAIHELSASSPEEAAVVVPVLAEEALRRLERRALSRGWLEALLLLVFATGQTADVSVLTLLQACRRSDSADLAALSADVVLDWVAHQEALK